MSPRMGCALGQGTAEVHRLRTRVLEMTEKSMRLSSPFPRPWGAGGAAMDFQARQPHYLWAAPVFPEGSGVCQTE